MNKVRSIKIGAIVKVMPSCFELAGLPESARGQLRVAEYGENWHGRYTLEVVNGEGERFNVMESELFVLQD